jgi:peptide/nickel transport system permease protein
VLETASLPRGLRRGLVLLVLLGLAALVAPLVATDRPWLARSAGRLNSPALASWIGKAPQPTGDVLLAAPIPYAPERIDLERTLEPPSGAHWLGTDALGRDLAARLLHGSRVSLAVGLLATGFALLIGVPLGALAGYRGGWADAAVSRLIEAGLCFPNLLLILVVLVAGPPWLDRMPDALRIALVLGVTGWMAVARYLRAEFVKLRTSDMVTAARAAGGGHLRIVVRHLLPCSLAPVLVTAAFTVGAAIVTEAALSFLGLGVRPPTATWGGMLFEAREQVHRAWWLALFPGLALFFTVLACNWVGEGLGDLLDPRRGRPTRRRRRSLESQPG